MEKKKRDCTPIIAAFCIILLVAVFALLSEREEYYAKAKEAVIEVEDFKKLETLSLDEIDSEEDAYYAMCIAEESNLEVALYNKLLFKTSELQREEEIVAYFKQLALKFEDRTYIDEILAGHEQLLKLEREEIKQFEKLKSIVENE